MEEQEKENKDDANRMFSYPLVRYSEMNEELQTEVIELCVTACEKYSNNNELAARMVKETLDQKAAPGWHVVIGEGYGVEITHDVKYLIFLYFNATLAILIWKCS
uniref:Dynein light chain n=1 Tax=Trichobilharzia regenti TaxID=157069 RepID=A0AA85IXY4_TRIRE|nr:unnamed protein product [Trichobilharzia regenti]